MASNGLIAQKLRKIADLLEVQDANPFRVRAYRNAARTLENLDRSIEAMVDEGEDLQELDGIGEDIDALIRQYLEEGAMATLEEAREGVPETVAELTNVEGVGPKRASEIYQKLDVTDLDELEVAAEAGEIAALEGLGEKTQQKILEGIEAARRHGERHRRDTAQRAVRPLLDWLRHADAVERVAVAGSYRRGRETVGDIDILFQSPDPQAVMEALTEFREVENVVATGEAKTTVTLYSGLQVDARSIAEESFGAALVYFTGSKPHNIALRNRALGREMSLSEYGLFEGKEGGGDRVAGATEEDIYKALDLVGIPPELREDSGEIEAAADNDLPRLIEAEEIAADIHMHTTWSDGNHSIEAMIEACRERGYHTVAITDHSPALAMTGGLDPNKLQRQLDEIAELRDRFDDVAVLSGMEVDILEDGSLDMNDEMLEKLDVVIVSVHSVFDLGEKEQTERVLNALDHPHVNILGHPTGRRINERDPMALDLSAVIEKAAAVGVALEINASPQRLDLSAENARLAMEKGVAISINTDAHSVRELAHMQFGVKCARRGWLTAEHVINTWNAKKLRAFLGVSP